MSHDPMRALHAACDNAGLAPRGDIYRFTCRCPAHEDRTPSLSVCEGADRRAVLHCHGGCDPADVVNALGLTWSDLFPDGHRHAGAMRRPVPKPVVNEHPAVAVLAALSVTGITWHRTGDPRLFTADRCPGCDANGPGALWVFTVDNQARLTCFNGCTFDAILAALEHTLTAYERAGIAA